MADASSKVAKLLAAVRPAYASRVAPATAPQSMVKRHRYAVFWCRGCFDGRVAPPPAPLGWARAECSVLVHVVGPLIGPMQCLAAEVALTAP
eukprot:NODE_23476_length_664_cov_5.804469.p1 GENE.NODE_23476_length_664_cov_5.804469~~NODE_23476_length_664_cov_5.804469.p1  ORF type:complete len:92 (-),score=8.92 NODE_23476_length_664_cov_5.804469:31-306(-)